MSVNLNTSNVEYPRLNNLSNKNDNLTNDQALERFTLKFEETFKVKSKPMTEPEKLLVRAISQRIWSSSNVQSQVSPSDKYQTYSDYMTSYYKGAHFIFEEAWNDSLLIKLKQDIGFEKNKKNLGREQLAARVSSHYVRKVGEQDHVHLAGNHVPETVFGEVALPVKGDTVIPGMRYSMYLEKHADEASQVKAKKFFWIQTENNPDGPDWISYLKHRTVDFVIYTFRKKMGYQHANVGPYGYGPSDKTPIIIRLQ
jgi:hypothetical protein